nr:tRNA-splicing endonuclease subunit Sen34 [Helicoverpa armigera]
MISLYVDNGIAYVWNSEDWFILRANHRICGSLIGSIPSFPRQNDFLGLPMALTSEEAALLVEKGVCELFELPNLTTKPTEEEKQRIKDLEQNVLAEQTEALKKRKIEQLSQKIDIIIAGKRQKLLSKGVTDIQLDKQTLLQEEISKLPKLAPAHVLTHLPTEHYIATEKKIVNIDVLHPSVVEGKGAIKYKIFKNLWEKHYHITNGSKFGCDYLLYPGDPVRFHATYMVRCIYDHTATISPAQLVAFGRLSVAVNKLAVLAFYNCHGKLEYQTLQWHDNVI